MSRTEAALQALRAALLARSVIGGIPAPLRNETMPTRFPAFGSVTALLNLLDGDGKVVEIDLGNPDDTLSVYHIEHRAEVEWIVEASDNAAREAAFDAGLVAINAALAADRTLGGVVDFAEIVETLRTNLVTTALPGTKAIVVVVMLSFISNAPF